MVSLFNVDVDNLVIDHTIQYQNARDKFLDEVNKKVDNTMKIYKEKIEEQYKVLQNISDVMNKNNEGCEKLKNITAKIEDKQQLLKEKSDTLSNVKNKCKLLEDDAEDLLEKINAIKTQTTQVLREKRGTIRKLKTEINSFKSGVNLYEQYLQLNLNFENKGKNTIIYISMKNIKNHTSYKIILEEIDNNNYILIDILPHSQLVAKIIALYNQNKDIQGLLSFLYDTKE